MGVLALQGAFALHQAAFERLGVQHREVRRPTHLDECTALVIPGGESTSMSKLLINSGLFEAIAERLADSMAVFGTCAGAILLADEVLDGRDDQRSFAAIKVAVRRNAYGRQVDSFETDLAVSGESDAFHAVFIRAPGIESVGASVEVLATYDGYPVLCESGDVMIATFHPELGGDDRLHRHFVDRYL